MAKLYQEKSTVDSQQLTVGALPDRGPWLRKLASCRLSTVDCRLPLRPVETERLARADLGRRAREGGSPHVPLPPVQERGGRPHGAEKRRGGAQRPRQDHRPQAQTVLEAQGGLQELEGRVDGAERA